MTAFNYFESEKVNFIVSVVTFCFVNFYIQFVFNVLAERRSNKFLFRFVVTSYKCIVGVAVVVTMNFLAALHIPLNPILLVLFVVS